jgi:hypothetical protein
MRFKRKGAKMIREYFTKNCISIRQWAKKHNLDERTTYYVINGEITGSKNNSRGKAKMVFEALVAEGIIDELPENLKEEKAS